MYTVKDLEADVVSIISEDLYILVELDEVVISIMINNIGLDYNWYGILFENKRTFTLKYIDPHN